VGEKELALIRASGDHAFPPRLPEQPIFYPVLNETYAAQIARDWNARDGRRGYVTRFAVRADFLRGYEVQTVGSAIHQEYWIPAEELHKLNRNIVGPIEVIAEFPGGHAPTRPAPCERLLVKDAQASEEARRWCEGRGGSIGDCAHDRACRCGATPSTARR